MNAKPATNHAQVFSNTASKGSYRNKTTLQPRGGKSWK